jgi:hypothetical protein
MAMATQKEEGDRFRRILALTPRRFHISATPPFAAPYDYSLVLCGMVEGGEEDGSIFSTHNEGIKNCKPGIWTSRKLPVSDAFKRENFLPEEGEFEALLYWVSDGLIEISQPVEDWEAYEKATREHDIAVELKTMFPNGTKWKRNGSYYDDGGVCSIISADYLTRYAASKIMGISFEDDDFHLDGYFGTLTEHGWEYLEPATTEDNYSFTLGGMNCMLNLF